MLIEHVLTPVQNTSFDSDLPLPACRGPTDGRRGRTDERAIAIKRSRYIVTHISTLRENTSEQNMKSGGLMSEQSSHPSHRLLSLLPAFLL